MGTLPPPPSAINGSNASSIHPTKDKGIAVGNFPAAPSRPALPHRETGHNVPSPEAGKSASTQKVPSSVDAQPPTRSWAAVTRSATKGYSLSYIPPAVVDNKVVVQISEEILQAAHPKWDDCLVGYYIGKRLPFQLTEDALKHAWGNHLVQVIAADLGFYFFHIPDKDFRRKVLEGVPITIAKIPLILQQWHRMMELKKDCHKSVPIWVRLRNALVNLWSASGISALASAIDKPLFVDNRTEQMAMVAFPRICIEIDASSSFPEVIDFMLNGEPRSVDVYYEWVPTLCPSCCSFGHRCADPKAPGPPRAGSLAAKGPSVRPSSEWREVGGK
ncbi:hypothetical protein ACJRO7_023311 [Eucalyptus globulus]|uniref:DUF4283 domain-containing protein n=1 Tax=Eucalyptus globulus TaxID=34317 RepID=A0ABD3KEA9_EUCGL